MWEDPIVSEVRRLLGAGKLLFPAGLTLLALSAQVRFGAAAWLLAAGILTVLLAWSGLLAELNKSKQQALFLALVYLVFPVALLFGLGKNTPASVLARNARTAAPPVGEGRWNGHA